VADQHIYELTNDPYSGLCENEFAIAYTWIIDTYSSGDWNGILGNLVKFYSDTSGSQATINLSAIGNINVSYVSFKDINFINGIVYADETCQNLGDNSGIVFAHSITQSISSIALLLNSQVVNVKADISVLEILEAINLQLFVSPSPYVTPNMFGDYADNYNSMGSGTNDYDIWMNYDLPSYNQERRLFNNLITEAYNMHGISLTYFVTSYDTSYDSIFGEDNDRRFIRTFNFQAFYQLPKEEKLWSKFGIEGLDQFSMYVSKLHYRDASGNYIPRVGDIINSIYNNFFYEVVDIKETASQFLLSEQYCFEFVVKPFKDERIQTTAATSGTYIQDYTNKSNDIFDIKVPVETKNEQIKYVPGALEKPSNDPFNGWN
jgi:hypothetical protein